MWLKKFYFYQIDQVIDYDEALWLGLFERMKSVELARSEKQGLGWSSPIGEEGPLFLHHEQGIWLNLAIQSRNLPASTLKRQVAQKLDELVQMGEQLTARLKREVKEDVEAQMLTQAFVEHADIPVFMDLSAKYLLIGAGSDKQADMASSYLRKTLGSLPISLPQLQGVSRKLTGSLSGSIPAVFSLASQVWMQNAMLQTNKATFSGCELPDSRVSYAIEQGMVVKKLGLHFGETLRFTINEQMQISGVSYNNDWRLEHQDHALNESKEHAALADMILLRPVYAKLVAELVNWLGEDHGENEHKETAGMVVEGSI